MGIPSRGVVWRPRFLSLPTSARRSWAERTDGLRGENRSVTSLGKSALALACTLAIYHRSARPCWVQCGSVLHPTDQVTLLGPGYGWEGATGKWAD